MTDQSRERDTVHAPHEVDFDLMPHQEDLDGQDEFEELAPYRAIPGAPEWFNEGRRVDWEERALVLKTLREVRQQNALAQRQQEAQQKHERHWKTEVEARLNRMSAEQELVQVRVDILREQLKGTRALARQLEHKLRQVGPLVDDGK